MFFNVILYQTGDFHAHKSLDFITGEKYCKKDHSKKSSILLVSKENNNKKYMWFQLHFCSVQEYYLFNTKNTVFIGANTRQKVINYFTDIRRVKQFKNVRDL